MKAVEQRCLGWNQTQLWQGVSKPLAAVQLGSYSVITVLLLRKWEMFIGWLTDWTVWSCWTCGHSSVLSLHLFLFTDALTINYKDSRWVGAWWLGFLVTGAVMLLAGIPFWFLPRSLPKQGGRPAEKNSGVQEGEQDTFITTERSNSPPSEKHAPVSMADLARGASLLQCQVFDRESW